MYRVQLLEDGWSPGIETSDLLEAVFAARWFVAQGSTTRILRYTSEIVPVYFADWYYSNTVYSFQDPLLSEKYKKYHAENGDRIIIGGELMANDFQAELQLELKAWNMPKEEV